MKFKYTALGANNQKLEGVLEAETLDGAREQLHKMNLAVLAITELSAEEEAAAAQESVERKKQEGINTYFFVALDNQKKEVNGTIDSREPSSAFRRLMMEYQFDVLDLYPENSPDPEGESFKSEFTEWKQLIEEEIAGAPKKAGTAKKEAEPEEKINAEIVAEMDAFIINTKTIIKDYKGQYSDLLMKEIERILGELERIRASNNLKHITKLCNELYELISNPDAIKEDETNEKYDEVVSKIKNSGFVANSFQLIKASGLQKKMARFEKIQGLFSKIQMAVRGKKSQEQNNKLDQKLRSRRSRWLTGLTRGLRGAGGPEHPTLTQILSKVFSFLTAPSPILRRARKQELGKTWKKYLQWRTERHKLPKEKGAAPQAEAEEAKPAKPKKDYSPFFAELDSFVGWLLFFYITYFFLVSFSIEKDLGLSKILVLKTLSSPLILNISIFLIFAHLAFTLKIRFFKSNLLGSLFLFFLLFGCYTLLIINF